MKFHLQSWLNLKFDIKIGVFLKQEKESPERDDNNISQKVKDGKHYICNRIFTFPLFFYNSSQRCVIISPEYKVKGREKMENRRIRIVDIADELGLSTATVSNVIHGKTKKISDETVRRVQELLEEKQYIPSMAGILLAQNNSRIIGVVVNNHEKYEAHVLEDNFIAAALNELSLEIEQAGYFMMVKTATRWEEIGRFASMWNMEGLVLVGFCEQDYMKLRGTMHIPFVIYDGELDKTERLCNLTIDNFDGGYQIGSYFRKMGHNKGLCISDNDICMDKERFEGFRAAMGEEGADFLMIPMEKEERRVFYRKKLKLLRTYSAIFAVSDYYAIEVMQFLQEQGVRVPEEISVAGFDDVPLCEMVCPTLTTIRQDKKKRAQLAIEMLEKLKEDQNAGTTVTLPVNLVERKSVAVKK